MMKKILFASAWVLFMPFFCGAKSLETGTPILEMQISPGNAPTQRVEPGTENVEVLRIRLSSSLYEATESMYSEGIAVKKLKFKRISDHDRDQILRYKLMHQNKTLGTISLPDSDVMEFKNLSLVIPYGKTFELKILTDLSAGDQSGSHKFEISDPGSVITENKDVREPIIFVQGKFPIQANRILIGKSEDYNSPPSDCNLREEPVCGVDGKTYYNLCIPYQKGVKIDYEGACQYQKEEVVVCEETEMKVCGNDGNTYVNRCFLNKAGILWDYDGECFPANYQRPRTYKKALELYDLKANQLLQLRPRISNESVERIGIISHVLKTYQFTFDAKETLTTTIADFLDFSHNLSSRTRLEQEIETLRIAIIRARTASAKEKYEQDKIPFLDVDENEWFFQHVQFLKDKEWVSGYQDQSGAETGVFEPGRSVSNAEITKMAFRAGGIYWNAEATGAKNDFAKNHWAEALIKRAEDLDIELWADEPNPEKKVNRGEVLQLLFDVFEVVPPTTFGKKYFPDVSETHDQYRYIQFAKELGIIDGYPDGTFLPDDSISRAEVAKVLKLAFEKLPKAEGFEEQMEEEIVKTSRDQINIEMYSVPYISPNFHFYMKVPGLFRFQSFEAKENEIMRFGFAKSSMYTEADVAFWLKIIAGEQLPEKTLYKKSGQRLTIDFPRDRYEKSFFRVEGFLKDSAAMDFLQKSIKYSNPEEDPSVDPVE